MRKKILDACCGTRQCWYDKECEDAIFMDIRELAPETLSNGQVIKVQPDLIADFTDMPFDDDTFDLVLYDPPHFSSLSKSSWMAKKYGVLDKETGYDDIKRGFDECWRVLKRDGVMVMKWSYDKAHPKRAMKLQEMIRLIGKQPLFGSRPGTKATTYWLIFMKK